MKEFNVEAFFNDDYIKFNFERWGYTPEGVSDFRSTESYINNTLKAIPGTNLKCLDVGSGTGIWIDLLKLHGCVHYCAVDISNKMLEVNNAHFKYKHDFARGLPSEILNNKYDVVLFVHSLEYVENIIPVIEHSKEILSEHGLIIIVTKNKSGLIWKFYKYLADMFAEKRLMQFWRNPDDFKFSNMTISCSPVDIRFPTMVNNVNDSYRFKGNGKVIRIVISRFINPCLRLFKSYRNPFAWHIGITLKKP